MSLATTGLLLDTCAALWFAEGMLTEESLERLFASADAGVFISPITGWEIGILGQAGKIHCLSDPLAWYSRLLALPGIAEAPFTGSMAIAAYQLPGDLHKDPADRLLIATARAMGIPIMTGDRKILRYAEAGHVKAIEC